MYSGMFHLPGCRAALGSRDWVVAVLLTAATASGCTAWVLCAFLLLWSNFAEAKRAWKSQRLFASSPVPGPLIAENSLAAPQEQITPHHRTDRLKIDVFPNPKRN